MARRGIRCTLRLEPARHFTGLRSVSMKSHAGSERRHARKIWATHLYGFKEWQVDVLKRLMEAPQIEYLELVIHGTTGLGEGGKEV
jgi:hypothetical protein